MEFGEILWGRQGPCPGLPSSKSVFWVFFNLCRPWPAAGKPRPHRLRAMGRAPARPEVVMEAQEFQPKEAWAFPGRSWCTLWSIRASGQETHPPPVTYLGLSTTPLTYPLPRWSQPGP